MFANLLNCNQLLELNTEEGFMSKPKKEMLLLAVPSNCGKTFTINLLYNKLKQFNEKEQDTSKWKYDKLAPKSKEEFQKIKDAEYENQDDWGDIQETVTINGITIGFASASDEPYLIDANMKFFEEKKCDICITACSCLGILGTGRGKKKEMIQKIRDFKEKHKYCISQFDFMGMDKEHDFDYSNNEKARMMFDRLKYLLSV